MPGEGDKLTHLIPLLLCYHLSKMYSCVEFGRLGYTSFICYKLIWSYFGSSALSQNSDL